MPYSKNSQRGATLAGYAIILSAFTAVSLGAVEGLNNASETYLEETSDDIAASREISIYDELDEIPEPGGDGGDTDEDDEGEPSYELADGGQFENPTSGDCITKQSDGSFAMAACDGSPEQQISVFTNADTGASQLRIGGECIGLENNSSNNSDPYIVQDCDDDNPNQLFLRNEANQTWESANNRSPVMCLDASGSGRLHQYGCHGGGNQEWKDPATYVPPVTSVPDPSVSGGASFEGTIAAGTDFSADGAYQSDDNAFVFSESIIVTPSDIELDDGTIIPTGSTVCSYIIWYDPVDTVDGVYAIPSTIDFGKPILGGAGSTGDLGDTSFFEISGVNYDYSREWEGDDGFATSGSSVSIDPYAVPGNADMIRVFTDCSS